MCRHLSAPVTLYLEEKDLMEGTLKEIIDMHCQNEDQMESKRINFKTKFN